MKIVIASSGLGHVARGIEAWASDLGRALAERGEDVITCKGGGNAEARYERVIPCWERGGRRTAKLMRWLPKRFSWRVGLGSGYGVEQTTFAMRLIDFLRRENVDVLHVQDPQVALIVQRAARMGLVPTRTILAHGTEEAPAFLRQINYLQHLAPWHLEEARRAGAWKPTWTAIPNFIDTELFRPGRGDWLRAELDIPAKAPVVLCVSAIKRDHKRVDYLLDEFETMGRDAYLVIAGGMEHQTHELIEQGRRRLGDRVRFLVRFPRSRMPELYRIADLFVLCSLKEMMPIALLEAIATGVPCVVNHHPVMQWSAGPGGEAIDMRAEGSLAASMELLLKEKLLRRAMGDQARRHCLAHFSTPRVVDDIVAYYRFVMEHQREALRKAG